MLLTIPGIGQVISCWIGRVVLATVLKHSVPTKKNVVQLLVLILNCKFGHTSNLDILKKTQGEKNSKLKEKTQ